MDMSGLPLFWLAYLSDPSDSGRIHGNVRQRWLSGASSCQTLCQFHVFVTTKLCPIKVLFLILGKGNDDGSYVLLRGHRLI